MWWGIVTITTTGYGDTYPVSPWGKLVASVTMVMSLMALALPIGIFGAYFSEIWNDHVKRKQQIRAEQEEKQKERRMGGRVLSKFDSSWQLEKMSAEIGEMIVQLQEKKNMLDRIREKMKKRDEDRY